MMEGVLRAGDDFRSQSTDLGIESIDLQAIGDIKAARNLKHEIKIRYFNPSVLTEQ